MRAALLALALGGLAMVTAEADAGQEKKAEPIIVTVKFWTPNDMKFLDPVPNIRARWYTREDGKTTDKDGNLLMTLSKWDASAGEKTEITFPDGTVYVVAAKPIPAGGASKILPVKKKS